MAVNDSLIVTSRLSSIKAVEDALNFMPDNPLRDPFAGVWMYMTNHFTKFQIATYGSFIVHEVLLLLIVFILRISLLMCGRLRWLFVIFGCTLNTCVYSRVLFLGFI